MTYFIACVLYPTWFYVQGYQSETSYRILCKAISNLSYTVYELLQKKLKILTIATGGGSKAAKPCQLLHKSAIVNLHLLFYPQTSPQVSSPIVKVEANGSLGVKNEQRRDQKKFRAKI